MLGAVAMNVVLTFGALLVVMVVGVGGYPISYTLWLAVDMAMNPLDAVEIADAAAHAAN